MSTKKKTSVFVGMSHRRSPVANYGGHAGGIKKVSRVFVGMSGGVDSSVAAFLLKKQGYDVTGVFIKCYNIDGCAERDAEDARRVAEQIGIPFYVFDFEKEYKKKVVDYMISGYRAGITPNPDVMCNREIKFGLFLKRALTLGADYVATGHYVRLQATPTRGAVGALTDSVGAGHYVRLIKKPPNLKIAKDKNKDQSYFLWTLTQKELKHCLFPLGDITKPEVRKIAKRAGLTTAEKKDSQGICFLGMFDVKDFLKKHIKTKKGNVVGTDGKIIGEHDGAQLYTIGQRHGFRLVAKMSNAAKPHYVAAKDTKKNLLVVAEGSENPTLFRKEIELASVNLVLPVKTGMRVMARVRYRQPLSPAVLKISGSKTKPKHKLTFMKPQKFVAEGQSAVFHNRGGGLVGGGIIV